MGADTKTNTTQGAAAHLRLEIIVSLRTAASAEAPSSPMKLPSRLRARDGMGTVRELASQWALTEANAQRWPRTQALGSASL